MVPRLDLRAAVQVTGNVIGIGERRAAVLHLLGQPGKPALHPPQATRQQDVHVLPLRNSRTCPVPGPGRVPLDHHNPVGMISQRPCRQQSGDTPAQHAGRVQQNIGRLRRCCPHKPVEHHGRRFCHYCSLSS